VSTRWRPLFTHSKRSHFQCHSFAPPKSCHRSNFHLFLPPPPPPRSCQPRSSHRTRHRSTTLSRAMSTTWLALVRVAALAQWPITGASCPRLAALIDVLTRSTVPLHTAMLATLHRVARLCLRAYPAVHMFADSLARLPMHPCMLASTPAHLPSHPPAAIVPTRTHTHSLRTHTHSHTLAHAHARTV
jgi:hypothetical protein